MAFDEIKKLAQALDDEIGRLDEETDFSTDQDARTFDMAIAESEKESMQDRLNDLTARNEELEDRVIHQNFIIELMKNLNEKLYAKVVADDALASEMNEINEVLSTYIARNVEIESLDTNKLPVSSSFSSRDAVSSSRGRHVKTQLKLAVELGELQMTISELKGALSMAVSKHEDHLRVRSLLEQQRQEERLERVKAEKQRDAYARAYEESLRHFKKIVSSNKKNKSSPATSSDTPGSAASSPEMEAPPPHSGSTTSSKTRAPVGRQAAC
jgi:hypothetical protein